ncbi:ribosome biogenesis factor YjgA [Cupriavidus alkaliphilus]|uniref:ribosome biogenesis factor YjgA n=1 Tax=Cupriavidus alkaliphilus TaxID=942866 RepID=UPI000815B8F5|nr:ribosome biogenesis factor YjgA [Cupriavidus alkaliphilus]MBB2916273.1 ribosome-associated protein [Cupriavidus alkaliphilus]MBB3012074.1 ribosome-associated protein [Cupriavidus alkaliphilus]PVY81325.1 ribosome-associated protein [Cupriavidus alkaliphilus]SCB09925.1 ribosome-associated protein [Cupriavidus alkaliphilus]
MTRNSRNHQGSRFPGGFAPEPEDDEPKSKSQRKRDMTALQDLGAELEALAKDRLARVPMPEALADAIREARRINSHEGKRRQMQYVGKIMRGLEDEEVEVIRQALEGFKGTSKAETARMHLIERWRELLLADDAALTRFLGEHPGIDVQALRNTIRNARKEKELGKPPRYFRELFQAIKTALDVKDGKAGAAEDQPPTPEPEA